MLSLVVLNGCMERQLLNTEELLEGAGAGGGGRQEREGRRRQANEQVSRLEDFDWWTSTRHKNTKTTQSSGGNSRLRNDADLKRDSLDSTRIIMRTSVLTWKISDKRTNQP